MMFLQAEERHGSAEERSKELEIQLQEKEAEIQRVGIAAFRGIWVFLTLHVKII